MLGDVFAYHCVEFDRGIEGESAYGLHQVIVFVIEVQALERGQQGQTLLQRLQDRNDRLAEKL